MYRLCALAGTMTEHDHQRIVVKWCTDRGILIFAIPNGGFRNKATAAKLKAEGVLAGVPDLFLAIANNDWHGLFIEIKKPGGTASSNQILVGEKLQRNGYNVVVCDHYKTAIATISRYLGIRYDR